MSTPATSATPQSRPITLRRATYVHVSDLTSAYNIDHTRLEQELSRVKAEREQLGDVATTVGRLTKKPREDETTGGEEGTAEDLETILPQKRLQPPRGGFNLCM
jgi:hypothetical protein